MKGEGNQIDYGMRVYDPRIGKFLSVDPLSSKYPWYTPYQFAGNTPIQAVDIDGREDVHYVFIWVKAATGKEVVLKLGGSLEGNETGQVDAQGRAVYDRPYKVHAHYPTNLYGRTVFSSATYDSYEAFLNAKAGDFTMSAIGAASEVSAEIANDVGAGLSVSYLFAKAGQYLTTKTISMLVEAKAAQYTASSVNRAAVDNLVKQNVDDALESGATALSKVEVKGFESFTAFKRAYGAAGEGQAWHHIVEQTPSNVVKFGNKAIHNTENLIKLPHGAGSIHAKISGYYSPKQWFTNGQTVRQWLSTQNYQQQYEFGIKTLKQFGGTP